MDSVGLSSQVSVSRKQNYIEGDDPKLKKSVFRSRNMSRAEKRKKISSLIMVITIHYIDQVLDYIYVARYFLLYIIEKENPSIEMDYSMVLVLFYILLSERYQQFFISQKIMEKIEKLKEQQNIQFVPKSQIKKKIHAFLMAITLTEPILYIQVLLLNGNIERLLKKKKLQDTMIENGLFLSSAFFEIMISAYRNNGEIAILPLLSMAFSYLNSVITLYSHNMEKLDHKYQQLKDRNTEDFKNFSVDLKLFLSYPCQLHAFKFLNSKEENIQKQIKYQNPVQTQKFENKSKWKQILIKCVVFLLISSQFVGILIGGGLQYVSKNGYSFFIVFLQSLVLSMPQVVTYLRVYVIEKKEQTTIRDYLKCISKFPSVILTGVFSYIGPYFNEHIPFVKETSQKWVTHSYSDIVIVTSRLFTFSYITYSGYTIYIKKQKENINLQFIQDEKEINYLLQDKGFIYYVYVFVLSLYVIYLLFWVLYVIEYSISKFSSKKEITNNHNENNNQLDFLPGVEQCDSNREIKIKIKPKLPEKAVQDKKYKINSPILNNGSPDNVDTVLSTCNPKENVFFKEQEDLQYQDENIQDTDEIQDTQNQMVQNYCFKSERGTQQKTKM